MTENQRDAIKESLKFNTDLIRILTLIILATATGVTSLILENTVSVRLNSLIVAGVTILSIFGYLLIVLVVRNLNKLNQLRND